MEIACVTLDCHEPRRLAEFWSAALGWHDVVLGTDGASIAWEEDFAPAIARQYRNVVLRDPEGNEFCLGGGTPPA